MAVSPSTPRRSARFTSDPVESPFPYNNSPLATTSPSSSRHNKNESIFTSTQIREITTIFQLFNPTVSGYLDIETFEVLMLSLGHRVTRQDVVEMVQNITSSSSEYESNDDGIDLNMTIQFLAAKGYATLQRNNSVQEMRMYFRLFDVDDKGYVTAEDL